MVGNACVPMESSSGGVPIFWCCCETLPVAYYFTSPIATPRSQGSNEYLVDACVCRMTFS